MPKGQFLSKPNNNSKYHPPEASGIPAVVITTSNPPVPEPRFEDVFATLAPRQQVWLAVRCTMDTDSEANEELEVTPQMSSRWKNDESFRFCYDRMAKPSASRERDLVAAIERSNAVRGAVEKQRLIMKPWEDCNPGEMRAKATLIEDTLERVSPKKARIEHRATRSMKDLITQGTVEAEGLPPSSPANQDFDTTSLPTDEDEEDTSG